MLIEHDNVLKLINKTTNFTENEDHVITKDLQPKSTNGNNALMCSNQIENSTLKENLNGSEQRLILNQSHDSICESYNSFHNLGMNIEIFKALNGTNDLNASIENNNVYSNKLDGIFETFSSSKLSLEHIDNNTTSVDFKVTKTNSNLTNLETMVIDQNHLDCLNYYESINPLETMPYINSKQIEEEHDPMKNDLIIQKQSRFDKKDKIKGQRSSQRLLHEAMSKKLLETSTNGLRPSRMTTTCSNLQATKAKSKEDEIKPIGNECQYNLIKLFLVHVIKQQACFLILINMNIS